MLCQYPEFVGNGGSGTFTQNDGTSNITKGDFYLGE